MQQISKALLFCLCCGRKEIGAVNASDDSQKYLLRRMLIFKIKLGVFLIFTMIDCCYFELFLYLLIISNFSNLIGFQTYNKVTECFTLKQTRPKNNEYAL